MPVSSAAKVELISRRVGEGADPRKAIIEAIGDLAGVDVMSDLVLLGTYVPSDKKIIKRHDGSTVDFYKTGDQVKESQYQGKVGLVLKTGPLAYADWEADAEKGCNAQIGSWVALHVGDGWPLEVNGVPCRLVPYEKIRLRVKNPNIVY